MANRIQDSNSPVVAIGGGHGLASTLKALSFCGIAPVGLVSVADDGGSSGRLREDFGLLPPGDVRKCLLALAQSDSVWASIFEYRFNQGDLEDHSLGNLIIAGLTDITGDFGQSISIAGELLGIHGTIYPSSTEQLILGAKAGIQEITGQVNVMNTKGIERVFVVPDDPSVPSGALEAIEDARMIVAGPGSLFTSVLAVLCIPRIRKSLDKSSATKVYVANLREQLIETAGLNIEDHIRALVFHGFMPDVVIADPTSIGLGNAIDYSSSMGIEIRTLELADESGRAHKPELLAAALMDV